MQQLNNGTCQLAVDYTAGNGGPGVLFCGGFKSNRHGQKALALESYCKSKRIPFVRFDYSGHGDSEGQFSDGNIDSWFNDTLCVIDHFNAPAKWIVVGSSMGGWIATLASVARKDRIAAMVTVAAAPDFTEKLMRKRLSQQQLSAMEKDGVILLPSEYDDGSPYPITRQLLEESRRHCILDQPIDIDIPVRLLHGTDDTDVPYELSVQLMRAIESNDVQLTLIKNGDHRLSEPSQLQLIENTIGQLHARLSE